MKKIINILVVISLLFITSILFFSDKIFASNNSPISTGLQPSSGMIKHECECPPSTDDALSRLSNKVLTLQKQLKQKEIELYNKGMELKLLENELTMRLTELKSGIIYQKLLIEKNQKLINPKRFSTKKDKKSKIIQISKQNKSNQMKKLISIIEGVKPKVAASVLSGIKVEKAARILVSISSEKASEIVQKMPPDKASAITAFLEAGNVEKQNFQQKKESILPKTKKTNKKKTIKNITKENTILKPKKNIKYRIRKRRKKHKRLVLKRKQVKEADKGFVFKPMQETK